MVEPVVAVVALSLVFALSTGLLDAGSSIAGLVLTRVARPGPALALAAVASVVGPLVAGGAVAATVAGIVRLDGTEAMAVLGAGLSAAVIWNLLTWHLGLPSSPSHALVGGLVGAAMTAGGPDAVAWGRLDGLRPVGVVGTLVALGAAPLVGVAVGSVLTAVSRRALRRAHRRVEGPIRRSEWAIAGLLAAAVSANDSAKAVGMLGAALYAAERSPSSAAPSWAVPVAAASLGCGIVLGGWGVVRTVGRRLFRIRPLDATVVGAGSLGVLAVSTALGAPVSTTQVVASSIVGAGVGRRRARHVRWHVVRSVAVVWVTTVPAAAIMGAMAHPLWRWFA